jgi:hypothetical protein
VDGDSLGDQREIAAERRQGAAYQRVHAADDVPGRALGEGERKPAQIADVVTQAERGRRLLALPVDLDFGELLDLLPGNA